MKKRFIAFESWGSRIARRPIHAALFVGLAPILTRLLLLPWFPAPLPRLHDEFSHLLLADTFAHSRLVNPVHPLWQFFESMHILVRPVYTSPYPPAQGAALALGQVITGAPWAGVMFSIGLMCAALYWMLRGWVSPGWALLGATLVAARFGVSSYWMNSFYGGAVPAAAGALVLGAVPRIVRRSHGRDAAILAAGVAILANSRPYEGFAFSIPIACFLAWRLRAKLFRRSFVVPLVAVLGVSALTTGYYFYRVTGSPVQMPYEYFRSNYTQTPHFIFQGMRPGPVYLHRQLWNYYAGWEPMAYRAAVSYGDAHGPIDKAKYYARFYAGPFLAIPLLAALWHWRRKRIRFLALTGLWVAIALTVEVWHAAHYAAPVMGLFVLLVVEGLRHLRLAPAGPWIVRAVSLASLFLPVTGGVREGNGQSREAIRTQLKAAGGNHLVLVRYAEHHDSGNEWVYNSADIDASPIVWAREMDPQSNRKLLAYFSGRQVWLLQPDRDPQTLLPFDPDSLPDPLFRFVPLGTQEVEGLRSPELVRQAILRRLPNPKSPPLLTCEQWKREFSHATSIEAPEPTAGCGAAPAGQAMEFETWFAYLEAQR
ncbi:MAG: hypothetical protein ABI995_00945 [Acidobacteriota bacterium]